MELFLEFEYKKYDKLKFSRAKLIAGRGHCEVLPYSRFMNILRYLMTIHFK